MCLCGEQSRLKIPTTISPGWIPPGVRSGIVVILWNKGCSGHCLKKVKRGRGLPSALSSPHPPCVLFAGAAVAGTCIRVLQSSELSAEKGSDASGSLGLRWPQYRSLLRVLCMAHTYGHLHLFPTAVLINHHKLGALKPKPHSFSGFTVLEIRNLKRRRWKVPTLSHFLLVAGKSWCSVPNRCVTQASTLVIMWPFSERLCPLLTRTSVIVLFQHDLIWTLLITMAMTLFPNKVAY